MPANNSETQRASRPTSQLNNLAEESAREQLMNCCGSQYWVRQMLDMRPFHSAEELFISAKTAASSMTRDDWFEAFSHHPRIGDREALRAKFAQSGSSQEAGEQQGIEGAPDEVLDRLASQNRAYEQKFGYIFLVCATGKSATEMLELLEARLHNDPADEFTVAISEHNKITHLRLEKLLA